MRVLFIGVLLGLIVLAILGPDQWWWNATAKTTGVGIFKGPASFGLFSSFDGIPLRDIHVTVWRNSSYSPFTAVIVEGNTDRTGIFSFLEHEGYVDYASYSYNGIHYTDRLIVGAILRDNVP